MARVVTRSLGTQDSDASMTHDSDITSGFSGGGSSGGFTNTLSSKGELPQEKEWGCKATGAFSSRENPDATALNVMPPQHSVHLFLQNSSAGNSSLLPGPLEEKLSTAAACSPCSSPDEQGEEQCGTPHMLLLFTAHRTM